MRARAVVIALLVVVGVGGVALLEWDLVRVRAARLRQAEREASSRNEPGVSPADAGGAGLASDRESNAQRLPIDEAKEPPRIPVDGVVVVTDSSGLEHAGEDGTFDPFFYEVVANPDPPRDPPCDRGEQVIFKGGHFHVDVPAERRFGAGFLVVNGRGAFVDSAPVDVREGDVVSIRAHWPRGVRLHVVDAATNAELDQVDVVRQVDGFPDSWQPHPGAPPRVAVVVDHGISPLLLDAGTAPLALKVSGLPWEQTVWEEFWIRARGHAWAKTSFDFERSSERTVELVAGATLVVDVGGPLPRSPTDAIDPATKDESVEPVLPKLRVREYVKPKTLDEIVDLELSRMEDVPADAFDGGIKPTHDELKAKWETRREELEWPWSKPGNVISELPAKSGETRVDGLQPGEIEVAVEFGNSDAPLRTAPVVATLVAGQSTRVTLAPTLVETRPKTARPRVPLAGTLFVGSGWPLDALHLEISTYRGGGGSLEPGRSSFTLQQMTPLPDRPGWYRWDAGRVTPATYDFEVENAAFRRSLDLTADGNANLELVLPDAATLYVRFIEEASSKPVVMRGPQWTLDGDVGGEMRPSLQRSIDLVLDADGARWLARVPIGPGSVQTWQDEGWVLDDESSHADIHAGTQELAVKVHHTCGVILQFKCGEEPVLWEADYGDIDFSTGDEDCFGITSSPDGRLRKYTVANPGHYRITIPRIPGFQAVPPVEVDIPAEKFITTTVELKRR